MFNQQDIIDSYTRSQAIEDGVLIEAGLKFPVAVTASVWAEVITPDKYALRHGESESGRLWDVLSMLRFAAATHFGSTITYQLIATKGGHQRRITLKAICGPGDELEPIITIMLPHED